MNIGCHRNFQLAADGRKNLAALADFNSAKRADRSSVGFVVGGLENKINIFGRTDCRDFCCHAPGELLRFNHARPQNERGTFSTNRVRSDFQWLRFHNGKNESGNRKNEIISLLLAFLRSPLVFFGKDRQWQMAHITREKKVTQLRASLEGKEAANRTENLKLKMLPVYAEGTRNSNRLVHRRSW